MQPPSSASSEQLAFYNLALGATTTIQNLYALKNPKNEKFIQNAALIVTESNINDTHGYLDGELDALNLRYRHLHWFYQELYFLQKPVLVLILPARKGEHARLVNNINRALAAKFGFSVLDMQHFYERHALFDFAESSDWLHPLGLILRQLGRNIIEHHSAFAPPKPLKGNDNPEFVVLSAAELQGVEKLRHLSVKNSLFSEETYELRDGLRLQIPPAFSGYLPIALHAWSSFNGEALDARPTYPHFPHNNTGHYVYSCAHFSNRNLTLSKICNFLDTVVEINYEQKFVVDGDTYISCSTDGADIVEINANTQSSDKNATKHNWLGLVGVMLARGGNWHNDAWQHVGDVPPDASLEWLLPPILDYKELIEDYCMHSDYKKLQAYEQQWIKQANAQFSAALAQERERYEMILQRLYENFKGAEAIFGEIVKTNS